MKAHHGAEIALQAAETALYTLRRDLRLSGPQPRQRSLIRHVSDALDTLKWHIDLERSTRECSRTSGAGKAAKARQ